MNDILCNVSESLFTDLYAADTSVGIHGKDMFSIITTINHELYKLSTCLKANILYLILTKHSIASSTEQGSNYQILSIQ